MALLTPPKNLIQVELTDRVFNDTRIKQLAVFELLEHRQRETTGESYVKIALIVKSYANDNGVLGIPLHDKGMPDKTVYLNADNDTVVDATTGAILVIFLQETPAEREATIAAFTEDVMLQGDFFGVIRDNAPVTIGTLIRQHIAQADAMGKFA